MKVHELIDQHRLSATDFDSPNDEIVAWLRKGDSKVFLAAGGLSNPEIKRALSGVTYGSITPSRTKIVVPRETSEPPFVYVDGKLCKIVSMSDAQAIENNPAYLPAASVDRRTITIYPKPVVQTPGAYTASKNTRQVKIVYNGQPDEIRYYGGLTVTVSTSSKYGTGTTGLRLAKVIAPTSMPYVTANELVGGYVSVQISSTVRADYRIEEHVGGELTELYVASTPDHAQIVDMAFVPGRTDSDGFTGDINKTSDLPESMHNQIAIESAALYLAGRGVQ